MLLNLSRNIIVQRKKFPRKLAALNLIHSVEIWTAIKGMSIFRPAHSLYKRYFSIGRVPFESPEWNDKGSYPIIQEEFRSEFFPLNKVVLNEFAKLGEVIRIRFLDCSWVSFPLNEIINFLISQRCFVPWLENGPTKMTKLTKMTKFIRNTKNGPNENGEIYQNDEKLLVLRK